MQYSNIYNAVENIAFNVNILTTDGGIKDWIKAREEEVWMYADWPLKESSGYSVTVSGTTVPLPATFTQAPQAMEVFNNYGDKLEFLDPKTFNELVQSYTGTPPSGVPGYWTLEQSTSGTVVTPVISLDLNANGQTYKVAGWQGPVCRDTATTYKLGTMSADTDRPWWDVNHYFLVSGAIALGKRNYSDPTWQSDEKDFQDGLERLKDQIIGRRTEIRQWSGLYTDDNYPY